MVLYLHLFLLFLLQSILIITRPIYFYPEMYLLPWITSFGNIPYVNFLDHHGFLLNIILAPFSRDQSFTALQIIFLFFQTVNLVCILYILKAFLPRIISILFGLFYITLNFFFVENILWYETIITSCFLLIYIAIRINHSFKRNILIGLITATASFIKPNALLIILPLLVLKKSMYILITIFLLWIFVILFYISIGGFDSFYLGLFTYNKYLFEEYSGLPLSHVKFYLVLLITLILGVCLTNWNNKTKYVFYSLSFLFISLIFLGMGYGKEHMVPLSTFYVITLAHLWSMSTSYKKHLLLCIILLTFLLSAFQVKRTYSSLTNRPSVQHAPYTQQVSHLLKPYVHDMPSLFVISHQVEHYYQYYYFDILPQTQYPIAFPLIENILPDYEKTVVHELQSKHIVYILIEHSKYNTYLTRWPHLMRYIQLYYSPVLIQPTFTLYKLN